MKSNTTIDFGAFMNQFTELPRLKKLGAIAKKLPSYRLIFSLQMVFLILTALCIVVILEIGPDLYFLRYINNVLSLLLVLNGILLFYIMMVQRRFIKLFEKNCPAIYFDYRTHLSFFRSVFLEDFVIAIFNDWVEKDEDFRKSHSVA
jgi:hypothetical protein